MEQLFNVGVFLVFGVLWAAFAVATVGSQGSLDEAWRWITGLHVIVQGLLWLLFLPVMAGLWVWETTWPLAWRLVALGGLGFANLFLFFPRPLFGGRP